VVVLVIAGGYFEWNSFQYEDTDDAQVDGHVKPLSPRINGYIKAAYIDEEQLVHADEAIVTIDAQDYKIAEELEQADLNLSYTVICSPAHPSSKAGLLRL
jgi:membrane fusion protein, multidrug efflux system